MLFVQSMSSAAIPETCGTEFFKVTPGIRLADNAKDDQKRIATPEEARKCWLDSYRSWTSDNGAQDPLRHMK